MNANGHVRMPCILSEIIIPIKSKSNNVAINRNTEAKGIQFRPLEKDS